METFDEQKSLSTDPIDQLRQQDRLFIGIYPTGIAYADRQREVAGDYQRLAFLSFATLQLDIESFCPTDLALRIRADAVSIQARRGEAFQISTAGQTVRLGYAL